MTINLNASEKMFLADLFHTTNRMGQKVQKSFALQFLQEACSVLKKLLEQSEPIEHEGEVVGTRFLDGEVEFTLDEVVFVRKLVEEVKETTPALFETLNSLREAFKKEE